MDLLPAAGSRLGRRSFLAGATGLIAAGLAACSGGGQGAGPDGPSGPGFPVSVPNRFGTAEIDRAPERVVSLGITDHDVLLALGIIPAGLTKWGPWSSGVGPWAQRRLDGQRPEVLGTEVNVESIIALAPDVVTAVQSALTQEQYNRLESFGPVVAQPPESIDYGVDWRVQAETIGRAVGKRAEAERLIADTQGKIDRTRRESPQLDGKTHVVVRTDSAGTYAAYSKKDARTVLLEQLGMRLSPSIADLDDEGKFNVKISKEQVGLLDADVVVVTTAQPTDVEAVRNDELLMNLPAARRGSLVLLDDYDLTMALGSATVSSIPFVLDRLTPKLVEAAR
ncbi:ABC transporter substrate-binding protein [Saccharopolyspora sp. HNM0983]|uniref:ABC transporter substrate-binding protein n=1 Tax=Saccharopolyspora montiporae TaxID=2781240 RepID=A0A929G043_9PSEU|nr:ABC transporter substrate-binding protein [Saccharopolyspora sp. HNM0983]MBE9373223.1 ABC transporter substrate-binding protein [Saccharopolyspora sp. HNM0983]